MSIPIRAWNPVRTNPGNTAITRTLLPWAVTAIDSVNAATYALLALYPGPVSLGGGAVLHADTSQGQMAERYSALCRIWDEARAAGNKGEAA